MCDTHPPQKKSYDVNGHALLLTSDDLGRNGIIGLQRRMCVHPGKKITRQDWFPTGFHTVKHGLKQKIFL